MKGLFGGTQITGASVRLSMASPFHSQPAQAIQAGMLCPEDRKAEGLFRAFRAR